MKRQWFIGVVLLLTTKLALAVPYELPAGAIEVWREQWRDAKREHMVPVKIYFPTGAGPYPIVVFSHGLGGTRETYEYLGRYWAGRGYVVVHLQHIGSDDSVWRGGGGMQALQGAMNATTAADRARDVSFAIDQLTNLNKTEGWVLQGKLDVTRIGMAGHSFGANTTLLVSGMKMPLSAMALSDARIRCAIAMSSPPPAIKNNTAIYQNIKIPMLHMTGTKDTSPVDPRVDPIDRRIPYDNIDGAGYLVTFAGGDHMVFSGRQPLRRNVPSDARNHSLIQQSTTAFWDAFLKDDDKALDWLRHGFAGELGENGVFEQKATKVGG